MSCESDEYRSSCREEEFCIEAECGNNSCDDASDDDEDGNGEEGDDVGLLELFSEAFYDWFLIFLALSMMLVLAMWPYRILGVIVCNPVIFVASVFVFVLLWVLVERTLEGQKEKPEPPPTLRKEETGD